ncbi:hypothetical protein OLL83_000387 [Shewanella algae]|uniref:hypothetical protein n=1 Tax=Shewanella algae TaxID=38313 RepID=UPI002230E251|nr:hypothetical protein [Shewanella algae]UZD58905.1 hypothetical protein OLL83_000387 [Shewanella algae]
MKYIRYDVPASAHNNHIEGVITVDSAKQIRAAVRSVIGLKRVPNGTVTYEITEEEYKFYLMVVSKRKKEP